MSPIFPSKPHKILAFDPGGTTGMATYDSLPLSGYPHHMSLQIGGGEHHEELYEALTSHRPDVIVCESFEYRQFAGVPKAKVELVSRDYIGVIKLYAQQHSITPVFHTASAAKAFVTDDKLKALDVYKPGNPHANDAMRHLIFYRVSNDKQAKKEYLQYWKKNAATA